MFHILIPPVQWKTAFIPDAVFFLSFFIVSENRVNVNRNMAIYDGLRLDTIEKMSYNLNRIFLTKHKEEINMTTEQIRNLKTIRYSKTQRYLADTFGGSAHAAAFVLAKSGMMQNDDLSTMECFLAGCDVRSTLVPALCNALGSQWDKLSAAAEACAAEECAAFLLFDRSALRRSMQEETPECLNQLAAGLLAIRPTDSVADFCTGRGGFLRDAFLIEPEASYFGNEINGEYRFIALMRMDLLGHPFRISSVDTRMIDEKFDKIFSNFPFGMRRRDLDDSCRNASSADWMFAEKIMECLHENGRAAAVLTNGSTWNLCDREMRRAFIENGYIETVISLPENFFDNTMIGTVLMIFSFGNEAVTFVDATRTYVSGRRNNHFSEENLAEIHAAVSGDHPLRRRVPHSMIEEKNYNLYPGTYLLEPTSEEEEEEFVSFSDVIRRITRGTQIKANELDAIASETPTDCQFLKLSDIRSGIMEKNLAYITDIAPKYEKYCLKNGNLIISKNGLPIKITVAEVPEGRKILANGNLYIIELDTERVNPYYIKAYLESPAGSAALQKLCVGVTIPNIPVESLKNLRIPMIDLIIQDRVAEEYHNKQLEILSLRRRLAEVEDSLSGVYGKILHK